MARHIVLSTIAVWIAWFLLDWLIHGVILMPIYTATADMWRPQAEMKQGLLFAVNLIAAGMFSCIFVRLVKDRSLRRGLEFGLYYGIAVGVGMGYGTYAFMAIPYKLALGWFLGTVVEAVAAGAIVGLIAHEHKGAATATEQGI